MKIYRYSKSMFKTSLHSALFLLLSLYWIPSYAAFVEKNDLINEVTAVAPRDAVSFSFGRSNRNDLGTGMFFIPMRAPSEYLSSSQNLSYTGKAADFMFINYIEDSTVAAPADGSIPQSFAIVEMNGKHVRFSFTAGNAIGVPIENDRAMPCRLVLCDANGYPATAKSAITQYKLFYNGMILTFTGLGKRADSLQTSNGKLLALVPDNTEITIVDNIKSTSVTATFHLYIGPDDAWRNDVTINGATYTHCYEDGHHNILSPPYSWNNGTTKCYPIDSNFQEMATNSAIPSDIKGAFAWVFEYPDGVMLLNGTYDGSVPPNCYGSSGNYTITGANQAAYTPDAGRTFYNYTTPRGYLKQKEEPISNIVRQIKSDEDGLVNIIRLQSTTITVPKIVTKTVQKTVYDTVTVQTPLPSATFHLYIGPDDAWRNDVTINGATYTHCYEDGHTNILRPPYSWNNGTTKCYPIDSNFQEMATNPAIPSDIKGAFAWVFEYPDGVMFLNGTYDGSVPPNCYGSSGNYTITGANQVAYTPSAGQIFYNYVTPRGSPAKVNNNSPTTTTQVPRQTTETVTETVYTPVTIDLAYKFTTVRLKFY